VFAWIYLDAEGSELGRSHDFADRAGAEAWMAEAWSGLQERGVDAVALAAAGSDRPVYRMSLAEEPA
jgi:hypothetical protein